MNIFCNWDSRLPDIELLVISSLESDVLVCKIKVAKKWLGAANRAQNAWNQAQNKWTNHVELEQFFEIFPMSCVVKMVER